MKRLDPKKLETAKEQINAILLNILNVRRSLACDTINTISRESLQTSITMMEDQIYDTIKSIHNAPIGPHPDTDRTGRTRIRWITRVPDSTRKTGSRKISATTEKGLLDKLGSFYGIFVQYDRNNPPPDSLLSLYKGWRKHRLTTIKAATVKRDDNTWKRYFKNDEIIYESLSSMTPADIQRWFNQHFAGKITRREWKRIRSLWFRIEKWGLIQGCISSPKVSFIDAPIGLLTGTQKRWNTHTYTPEELNAIYNAAVQLYAKSYHNRAYLAVAISAYLGFRVGELAAVRWDGYHPEAHYLEIWQQCLQEFRITEDDNIVRDGYAMEDGLKKEKPERIVSTCPTVENMLDWIRTENAQLGINSPYVFTNARRQPTSSEALNAAWRKVLTFLGWRYYDDKQSKWVCTKRTGNHTARFSFVTNLRKNERCSGREVQGLVGHASLDTTEDVYNVFAPVPPQNMGERIEEILGSHRMQAMGDKNMQLGDKKQFPNKNRKACKPA
ncbi:MAG: tyrosine-type recombinase/integrase [Eubacterium sp.]|nr:tyrosine-type recombinase/integrase [Eubacterium sp.]